MCDITQSTSTNPPLYHCEGFIKEVKVSSATDVTFTIEPVAPYLFEQKADGGKTERRLLFVVTGSDDAKQVSPTQEFTLPPHSCKCDLNTLLIVKANRMKVRVESSLLNGDQITTDNVTVL